MSLIDKEITELARQRLVVPFNLEMINPCSLDISIGYSMKIMRKKLFYNLINLVRNLLPKDLVIKLLKEQVYWEDIDLINYNQNHPFWLFHGDKILVASLETFNFPDNICAQFRLKSSRGREFYEHLEAGFCDVGWHGSKLTMEIECRNYAPLPIHPHLRIGQLIFERTNNPLKSYKITGRYNNDNHVEGSKG